jgi:hypothetical protein
MEILASRDSTKHHAISELKEERDRRVITLTVSCLIRKHLSSCSTIASNFYKKDIYLLK